MPNRTNPTVFALSAFLLAAALIWGCGGGGGGSSTGGGNGGGSGIVAAEASLSTGSVVDPLDIQLSDSSHFFLASYNQTTGARTTISVNGWTTNDTSQAAGILNSNGAFTPLHSVPTVFTASVNYNGVTYSVNYKVNPDQVRLTGSVINDSTKKGVRNVRLIFYTQNGVAIGSARSSFSGGILASVPVTAARFGIDSNTIDTSVYYNTFAYNRLRFSPLITTCTAALPTGLTNGATTALTTPITLTSNLNVPPGPPTGCQ